MSVTVLVSVKVSVLVSVKVCVSVSEKVRIGVAVPGLAPIIIGTGDEQREPSTQEDASIFHAPKITAGGVTHHSKIASAVDT